VSILEYESCNASNLNGTSSDDIKEVTLNMKLPVPVNKKPINQTPSSEAEDDPFAKTNTINNDFNSVTSKQLENISVMSGEQAALMAKQQLLRNIKNSSDQKP